MSASVPTPSLQRAQKGGLPASRLALVCLTRDSAAPAPADPSEQSPGSAGAGAVQAPASGSNSLFCSQLVRALGGRCGKCRLQEPGPRARGGWDPLRPRLPPSPGRFRSAGPAPLSPRRTRSRPSVRMPAASRLLLAPPPSRRPQPVPGASREPGGQSVGDGRRAPPQGPRGRCQGEGAGLCVSCSPGKQHEAPGA